MIEALSEICESTVGALSKFLWVNECQYRIWWPNTENPESWISSEGVRGMIKQDGRAWWFGGDERRSRSIFVDGKHRWWIPYRDKEWSFEEDQVILVDDGSMKIGSQGFRDGLPPTDGWPWMPLIDLLLSAWSFKDPKGEWDHSYSKKNLWERPVVDWACGLAVARNKCEVMT